jgi:sarcosine oxidase subunit gamma
MADIAIRRQPLLPGLLLPNRVGAVTVSATEVNARFAYRGTSTALGEAFGLALPDQPCRAAVQRDRVALWLGPDEWLLIAAADETASLLQSLKNALTGRPASLVDVSHRNIGLIVKGPRAADLLNAGCPLDLDPETFPVGMCARTLFGKAEVVLWRSTQDSFRLEAWRSFAPYVAGLLYGAAQVLPPWTARDAVSSKGGRTQVAQ